MSKVSETHGLAVEWSTNNGSVPPPYRHSTEISIDAHGHGRYLRLLGYDRSDPANQFEIEFALGAERMQALGRMLQLLGVYTRRWRERSKPPTGGSTTAIKFSRAGSDLRLPIHPIAAQQDALDAVKAILQELIPVAVTAARASWEAARAESE